jgi:hypothetical protein
VTPDPHEVTMGLPRSSRRCLELPAKSVGVEERAVGLVELLVREIQAPGNVAGAKPGSRLRLGSGEAAP